MVKWPSSLFCPVGGGGVLLTHSEQEVASLASQFFGACDAQANHWSYF